MFYSRAKDYDVEKPVAEKDRTGFETTSYIHSGTAKVYIVQKNATKYRTNELNLTESQFVGYTRDELEVGDRLGGKYVVDYVSPARSSFAVSLSYIG